MQVVTVPDANSYTVTFTSAATSTVSGGGGSSVTANYSKFYSVWKYTSTGWTTVVSNLSSVNVDKLRHNTNSFTGTEAVIICDGANSPSKLSGSTFTVHPTGGDYNPTGASFTTDFKNHQFYAGTLMLDLILLD